MNPVEAWKDFQDKSLYYQAVKKDGEESVWREIAKEYDNIVYPDNQKEKILSRLIPRLAGAETAIEIGAGTGSLTTKLSRHVDRLIAVEPSESMSAVLKKRLEQLQIQNVSVIQQKWEDMQIAPADVVIAGGCLYVFYDIDQMLLKMLAAAKSKTLITHIGNQGLWKFDEQIMEILSKPKLFLFPSLSLVTEVLVYLQIPAFIEIFFMKTKKRFTPEQWIKRCQRLFDIEPYQYPILIEFLKKEFRQEGDFYSIEEEIPSAVIELRIKN